MFRKTSPQTSLFQVESFFPGALPDDDWAFIYRDRILPIDEDMFKHLYSKSEGRPNAPIRVMVSSDDSSLHFRTLFSDPGRTLLWACIDRRSVM